MTSQHDKPMRWQFSVRKVLIVVCVLSIGFALIANLSNEDIAQLQYAFSGIRANPAVLANGPSVRLPGMVLLIGALFGLAIATTLQRPLARIATVTCISGVGLIVGVWILASYFWVIALC
jgi:hypothetical protein